MNEAGKMSKKEIEKLRNEIQELRKQCEAKEKVLTELEGDKQHCISSQYGCRLSNEDIERYSRQIILPNFGVSGQIKLKEKKFLIVGLGGLGCPASQYLAAAGCGLLGLVDYDEVERSNLHRQTLHTESKIGIPKVESAKRALKEINNNCQIICHRILLNSENAVEILEHYDIILDCTDNVATRYLLNDACVMLKRPLISGSALQMDGQLTVYNYGQTGPCYRCLFPVPPPPETVTNCGDGGVLGAVTGIIGSLQALEAIKVALDGAGGEVLSGRMLIFEGSQCLFRNIRLRVKRTNCDVCSPTPSITRLIDYEQFCGMKASDKNMALTLLLPEQRLSVKNYRDKWEKSTHILIDVRQSAEYEICNLPNSKNIPIKSILDDSYLMMNYEFLNNKEIPLIVLCRRGNDSQIAVQHLMQAFPTRKIYDIKGGLFSWHDQIDDSFPIY